MRRQQNRAVARSRSPQLSRAILSHATPAGAGGMAGGGEPASARAAATELIVASEEEAAAAVAAATAAVELHVELASSFAALLDSGSDDTDRSAALALETMRQRFDQLSAAHASPSSSNAWVSERRRHRSPAWIPASVVETTPPLGQRRRVSDLRRGGSRSPPRSPSGAGSPTHTPRRSPRRSPRQAAVRTDSYDGHGGQAWMASLRSPSSPAAQSQLSPSPPRRPSPATNSALLPEGWSAHTSRTGRLFFHHARTGTSQWHRPTRGRGFAQKRREELSRTTPRQEGGETASASSRASPGPGRQPSPSPVHNHNPTQAAQSVPRRRQLKPGGENGIFERLSNPQLYLQRGFYLRLHSNGKWRL